MDLLKEQLIRWNRPLSDRQEEQFERYYQLLVKKNEVMNLTAITKKEEVEEKHFLDSLFLIETFPLSGEERLIDVGTGAGFPGLPLKIVFPEMEVVLADALQKRVGFLKEVIEELELEGITAIHARAEDLGHDPAYREGFDLCVSRAVAPLNLLAEYCLPFVKAGGVFAAYKAVTAAEEAEEAGHAFEVLGGSLEKTDERKIGPSGLTRSFVIVRKTGVTPEKYPRAKAQKKPL